MNVERSRPTCQSTSFVLGLSVLGLIAWIVAFAPSLRAEEAGLEPSGPTSQRSGNFAPIRPIPDDLADALTNNGVEYPRTIFIEQASGEFIIFLCPCGWCGRRCCPPVCEYGEALPPTLAPRQ